MRKVFFWAFFVLVAISSTAQTNISTELQQLLPVGNCSVDLMELQYPPRFVELATKMQTAIASDKEWWMAYVKQYANSGEPLPYNAKLGLTKDEYKEYFSLGEKRSLKKVQSCTLVVNTNFSTYEFEGGSDLPNLTGLKVNVETLTITTPFGILKNPEQDESPGGPALGSYSGYRWHFEAGDINRGNIKTASFLIGRLKESRRNFIYYKGGLTKDNNPISSVAIVIYYDKR